MKQLLYFTGFCILSNTGIGQSFINKSENLNSHAIYLRSMDVQAADLNKDGYLDIVLAIEWAPNAILWGTKEGIYSDNHAMKLSKNLFDSEDVAIADYNNDGWLDLVFAAEDDQNHEFYFNKGNGKFEEVKNKFPKFTSNSVLAYDFNQDGNMDLIFGNAGQSRLFINDGKANFIDETDKRLPKDTKITQDIALIDVDNDGDMDLLIGNEDGNELWINNGQGFFTNETEKRFPSSSSIETRKVIVFDAEGDGDQDVFICNVDSDKTKEKQDKLYINNGKGFFVDATNQIPNQALETLDALALDVNEDGKLDLILAHGGKVQPSILINDGKGNFSFGNQLADISFVGNYISLIAADFNQDGKKDIYFGGFMTDDRLIIRK